MPAPPKNNPIRRHPILLGLALVFSALLLLILLWDWNWLRPMWERRASAALNRPVHIAHFDAEWSWHPRLKFEGVVIANPENFPESAQTATAERIELQANTSSLFGRPLRIEHLHITRPQGDLYTNEAGVSNWKFELRPGDPEGDPVEIADLQIAEGKLRFRDPKGKSDFQLQVYTEEPKDGAEPRLLAQIEGRYEGQPLRGTFSGSSLLTLRNPENPYPMALHLQHGATEVELDGTLLQPLQLGGANLQLKLKGASLDHLYALTGMALPPTAPYRLTGALDYADQQVRFNNFKGTVGSSDLSGDLSVTLGGERPIVRADLRSKNLLLADLGGFLGATPGSEDAANDTRKQKTQRAQREASGKMMPSKPMNLPRLRGADVHLSFVGEKIQGERMPFDNLKARLEIIDGRISVQPLSFAVGDGEITLNLKLDAQEDVIRARGDIDFRRVELARIMQTTPFRGAGVIGGQARIDSSGNSMAQMLGRGDGEVQLFMNGGNLSALLVDLTGLDFGNALLSALGIPSRADLRCMVADLELKKGQLGTRTLIVDTSEANVIGSGQINLRDEVLDYELTTQPKQPSIGALSAPIELSGSLRDPRIRPQARELGLRGGAAIVLGVFLTPLAALLPTIQLGLGKDHDCDALLASVEASAKAARNERPAVSK